MDANVLIAAYIDSDERHDEATSIVVSLGTPLYVPVLVLAEVSYFIDKKLGAEAEVDFIQAVVDREIQPVYFEDQWPRVLELASLYSDRSLGAADASVIASAERLFTSRVSSMDRRDLEGIRLSNGEYVDLVSFASQV